MNFRNPNKKRLQFSIDPRNIRTPYLKIIEFSILPPRSEGSNQLTCRLTSCRSSRPASHQFLHQSKHNQPVHPSYRVTWRARAHTHTHIRNQEIEPPLYIDIDSMEGRGEGGIETSPGKQTADERGEPRNIPVMRHGVKKRACWPHWFT